MRNMLKSTIAAVMAFAILPDIASAQSFSTPRNLLVNGEALVANTGGVTLTGVNTTATYGADGFAGFANNAAASVVVGRSTSNLPTEFQQAFSLNRTAANASTQQACMVQEIESSKVRTVAGKNMVFTAYLAVGATFSGALSNAQVTVIGGTGSDEGLATLLSGWAGATTIVNNTLVPVTTAYGRVGVLFNIPITVTELAVEVCWTPVGVAGATDTLFMTGAQLEVQGGGCPAVPVGTAPQAASAASVSCASLYEHLNIQTEIFRAARYFQQINEVNAVIAPCVTTASNVQACMISLSVPMRVAPTVTVVAGGFQMIIDGAAGTAIITMAGGTSSITTAIVTAANTTTVAAHGLALRGSLTTGMIAASARF